MIKPVNSVIFRSTILKMIESELQSIAQWAGMAIWENAAKYAARAEVLIELLEIDDCGSTGGFDTQRNQGRRGFHTLYSRYEWLKNLKE